MTENTNPDSAAASQSEISAEIAQLHARPVRMRKALLQHMRDPGRDWGKGANKNNNRIQFGLGWVAEVQGARSYVRLDKGAPLTVCNNVVARAREPTPAFGVRYVAIVPPMSVSLNVSDRSVQVLFHLRGILHRRLERYPLWRIRQRGAPGNGARQRSPFPTLPMPFAGVGHGRPNRKGNVSNYHL